jgi:hypothetical protein
VPSLKGVGDCALMKTLANMNVTIGSEARRICPPQVIDQYIPSCRS